MSFLNDPLYVETMLEERKVKPKDIEMAQLYAEVQAAKRGQQVRRPGPLTRLHDFLLTTWERRPQRTV